jgi:hypothetical protein
MSVCLSVGNTYRDLVMGCRTEQAFCPSFQLFIHLPGAHSRVGSWPYPLKLSSAGKACLGQTIIALRNICTIRL